jgi:hypothetical protein
MTTDTPRTDEEMWTTDYHHELCNVVNTEFAQQLERELNASKADVERLQTLPESRHKAFLELIKRVEKAEAEVAMLNAPIKVKISKRPYSYECGDGCCTEWGETWYVDGEEIASGPCEDNLLQRILERLGFDAEIVNENEDGDEVCSL